MSTRLLPLLALLAPSLSFAPAAFAQEGQHGGARGEHRGYDDPRHERAYGYESRMGTLTVSNQSGAAITLQIEGLPPRGLAPYETAVLRVPERALLVRATYVQFGQERLLQSDAVLVTSRGAFLAIGPEDEARLLVSNGFDRPGQVYANGRAVGLLFPGETEVVELPVGATSLELRVEGRVVTSTQMRLVPFAEPRWRAEPPPVGTLTVVNPLPIPVQLVCDKGMVRTLGPYERTTYNGLAAGTFHLVARRVTGERIDEEVSTIRGRSDTQWRIDAPRTGLVTVDSDAWQPVRVRVDGNTVARLAPDEDRRLEIALGWHRVEVRDDEGRVLLDTWVDVEPFDDTELEVGHRRPVGALTRPSHYAGALTSAPPVAGSGAGCSLPPR